MMHTTFGTIMAAYRAKYKLNQREICKGICAEATCVRAGLEGIEVDFLTQEALLGRMGLSSDDFELLLGDEEYILQSERGAIRSDMAGRNMEDLEEKLARYTEKYGTNHPLHKQFILYYRMKLACWHKQSAEEIRRLAEQAFFCTKESDEVPHCRNNLYSYTELDILLTMIQYGHENWCDVLKNGYYLKQIIEYVGVYYAKESREEIEGRAWIQLIRIAGEYESRDTLLSYIDRAIACFSSGTGIERLAEVRFIKAQLLLEKGDGAENTEKQIEQCKEECCMAYCIYEVLGCTEKVREITSFCEEKLRWHITMQMK